MARVKFKSLSVSASPHFPWAVKPKDSSRCVPLLAMVLGGYKVPWAYSSVVSILGKRETPP